MVGLCWGPVGTILRSSWGPGRPSWGHIRVLVDQVVLSWGPGVSKMAQAGPGSPSKSQHGLNLSEVEANLVPSWGQVGANLANLDLIQSQGGAKLAQNCQHRAKLGQRMRKV